jgi:hypothetical protein
MSGLLDEEKGVARHTPAGGLPVKWLLAWNLPGVAGEFKIGFALPAVGLARKNQAGDFRIVSRFK